MNFVIIGNSWSAAHDNPTSKHQIALALAEKGHKVLWIDGAGMRRPNLASGGDRAKIAGKLRRAFSGAQSVRRNIWRSAPLIIPSPSSPLLRRLNERLYMRAISKGLKSAGMSNAVLICFLPTIPGLITQWTCKEPRAMNEAEATDLECGGLTPLSSCNPTTPQPAWMGEKRKVKTETRCATASDLKPSTFNHNRLKPVNTVYYCVDRWDKFSNYDGSLMAELDAESCKTADLVITSAQELYERCKRHNKNTHLIEHGVDHAHFATALESKSGKTPPVANNQQPTTNNCNVPRCAGFFGLISEWIDQDLLLKLSELDNFELLLAGKADVDSSKLEAKPNIIMPGSVSYAELPSLIAEFDIGIIPFSVNELTRAVNPIKLREMLAAGCPVVSTDLPEVAKMARQLPDGAIRVAKDTSEFVSLVRRSLETETPLDERRRISDSVRNQDWSYKVDEVISLGCNFNQNHNM